VRTLKYNGERWYWDERSRWKRCRQWLIYIGGWEKANGKGWKFIIDYGNRRAMMSPMPISCFGHRFTCFGWGWQIRMRRGYLVFARDGLYVSLDGTPPELGEQGRYLWRRAQ